MIDEYGRRNGSRPELTRAGFVSRSTADLVDAVVVCLGTATIVLTVSMLRALFVGSAFDLPRIGGIAAASWLSLVYFLYLTFFWTATGRTPGKQVTGLRVVTSNGDRAGIVRATVRALLCLVFPIGLLWVLVSPRNRAVHDALTGTTVVYDWRGMPTRAPAADRGAFGMLRTRTDT